jgi:hypothetical protein
MITMTNSDVHFYVISCVKSLVILLVVESVIVRFLKVPPIGFPEIKDICIDKSTISIRKESEVFSIIYLKK